MTLNILIYTFAKTYLIFWWTIYYKFLKLFICTKILTKLGENKQHPDFGTFLGNCPNTQNLDESLVAYNIHPKLSDCCMCTCCILEHSKSTRA